jgi:hypothetical protein
MWFRVFGTAEVEPAPAALLEHLQVRGHFRGDDQGWFEANLVFLDEAEPLRLERFLASEQGIRDELNSWAAWIETATDSPVGPELMVHLIGTKQLFTLQRPNEIQVVELCLQVCRYLARATAGVYQVDEQGFFAADGKLLLKEES